MNEPGITPLAKRLAEENNVDWRSLPPSGSDGRIVERDVLSYLARVMAGDEALDPTPEPVPEGMEAWPDSDGFAADRVQQGSDAEDFGTAVIFDAAAAEERYEAPGSEADEPESVASGDDLELSEDIFLFGDDEDDSLQLPDVLAGAASAFTTDEEHTGGRMWDDSDDEAFDDESLLLVEDDDFFGLTDSPDEDEDSNAGFERLSTGSQPEADSGSEDWGTEDNSLGFSVEPEEGLLGRTDDLLDDSEFEDADLTDLAMEDGELDDPLLADHNLRAFEGTVGGHEESLETQALSGEQGSAPAPEEDFDVDFSRLSGWDEGDEDLDDEQSMDDEFQLEETEAASGYEADFAAALREATTHEEEDDEDTFALSEPDAEGSDLPFGLSEALNDDLQTDPEQPDEPALGRAPAAAMAPAGDMPLADFGTLLRRRLDVTQLSQAQQAVASELDLDEARSALPFLLRAAVRALRQVPLVPADATVAAAVIEGGQVRLVAGRDSGFRELAAQLGGPGVEADHGEGEAVLAVADMSGYEVDEAVLNLGMPVLTLGRALHDAETGSFRSTLTLSGHYDLEEGARFLQAASELLSNPLTLLI